MSHVLKNCEGPYHIRKRSWIVFETLPETIILDLNIIYLKITLDIMWTVAEGG